MNFDDMQKAWQSHDARAKVMIDAEVLLKEVRHNQRSFWAMIFWRDAREVGVAAWMTWLFLHWGIRDRMLAVYLLAFTCFGVGAFMVADRLIQRRKQPPLNDSLKACIEGSLFHVNHQIWLLRNVFWWYLLPLGGGIAGFLGYLAWRVIFRRGRRFCHQTPCRNGRGLRCCLLGCLLDEPVRCAKEPDSAASRIGNAAGQP